MLGDHSLIASATREEMEAAEVSDVSSVPVEYLAWAHFRPMFELRSRPVAIDVRLLLLPADGVAA